MSEQNFAGMAFRENLKRNPDFYAHIGPDGGLSEQLLKQLADSAKARQALDAKNAEARTNKPDLRKEYDALRQRLFNLKQDARCYEIRTNEAANKIRNIEQNIDNLLRLKAAANEAGNLRGVRMYEQSVERVERELTDAQEEFDKNKRWSGQAVRALKAFDGVARIEELKLLLEQPVIEVKK